MFLTFQTKNGTLPGWHAQLLIDKRWQVVVIVEGIEPTTSATLQSRHSYLVTGSDPDFLETQNQMGWMVRDRGMRGWDFLGFQVRKKRCWWLMNHCRYI